MHYWLIILYILLALVALCVAFGIYLVISSFTRREHYEEDFEGYVNHFIAHGKEDIAQRMSSARKKLIQLPSEDVWIKSRDGLHLHAKLIAPKEDTNKTIILVHGYHSYRCNDFSVIWEYYYQNNWRILLVDQRTHGESEGRFICFGVKERYDICGWVDYIRTRFGQQSLVCLHGISMGSATVTMAQSLKELEGKITAVVADCGFVSPKQQFSHMFSRMHLPKIPLFYFANFITKLFCGYWFGEVSCKEELTTSKTPILFIHGELDNFVPTECSKINYEACSSQKTLWIVSGGRHGDAIYINETGYFAHLDQLYESVGVSSLSC